MSRSLAKQFKFLISYHRRLRRKMSICLVFTILAYGSIMHAMVYTRSDTSQVVSIVSHYIKRYWKGSSGSHEKDP